MKNKKVSLLLWGIVLIALGLLFALNALDILSVNLFFDGWWTLFIIVPCAVSLFTSRDKVGSAVGVLIGVFLLLCCQGILRFSILWKLLVPAIIVAIGIKLIVSGVRKNRASEILQQNKAAGRDKDSGFAAFSGNTLNYNGRPFHGAELNAVFGGVKCDLRGAIITEDCAITASAVFGGIDILVSGNVNVIVTSNSIFGGVTNKTMPLPGAPTLYVNATCLFGGVDIK